MSSLVGRQSLRSRGLPPRSEDSEQAIKDTIIERLAEFEENLKCRVCLSVVRDPTSLPCSHFFCNECLVQHFSTSSSSQAKCPLCNMVVNRRARIKDPLIRNLSLAYRQLHRIACESFDLGLSMMSQDVGSFHERTPVKPAGKIHWQATRASKGKLDMDTAGTTKGQENMILTEQNAQPTHSSSEKEKKEKKEKKKKKRKTTVLTIHPKGFKAKEMNESNYQNKKQKSVREKEEEEREGEGEGEGEEEDMYLTPADAQPHDSDLSLPTDADDVEIVSPTPNAGGKVVVEPGSCHVCCRGALEDYGPLLHCTVCDVTVHHLCYGADWEGPADGEDWMCDVCREGAHLPHCSVCPDREDRILKRTDNHQWIHQSCAYWHAEPRFVNVGTYSPVDTSKMSEERLSMRCQFCKKIGACVQCSYPRCFASYHVPCAFRNGVRFELRVIEERGDDVFFHNFCEKHKDMGGCVKSDNATPSQTKNKKKKKKGKGNGNGKKGSKRKTSTSAKQKKKKKKNVSRCLEDEFSSTPSSCFSAVSTGRQGQNNGAEEDKLPVLLCTGLSMEQRAVWEVLEDELEVEVALDYGPEVTHIITGTHSQDDQGVVQKRTMKYYLGVLESKHIMCWDWIEQCMAKGELVPVDPYLVRGDTAGIGRIGRYRQLPQPLLSGYIIVVHNEFKQHTILDIRKAVRLAGGRVEKSLPFMCPDKLVLGHWVLLTESGEVKRKEQQFCTQNAIPVTTAKWLFDCISLCEIQPLE